MICSNCGSGRVEWKGPLSSLTHTECAGCGATNSQIAEGNEEDNDQSLTAADLGVNADPPDPFEMPTDHELLAAWDQSVMALPVGTSAPYVAITFGQIIMQKYAHRTRLQAIEAETIERCAAWHETQAEQTKTLQRAGWHMIAARAIRALSTLKGEGI